MNLVPISLAFFSDSLGWECGDWKDSLPLTPSLLMLLYRYMLSCAKHGFQRRRKGGERERESNLREGGSNVNSFDSSTVSWNPGSGGVALWSLWVGSIISTTVSNKRKGETCVRGLGCTDFTGTRKHSGLQWVGQGWYIRKGWSLKWVSTCILPFWCILWLKTFLQDQILIFSALKAF